MKGFPESPKPTTPQEEEKDYFSMSYEEVQKLPPEELAKAAAESGISIERFLGLKQRASENAVEEFAPSKDLTVKEGPETNFKQILRDLAEISAVPTVTEKDVEHANDLERQAYAIVDRITHDLNGITKNKMRAQAHRLFVSALEIHFADEYQQLVKGGMEYDQAYSKILQEYKEKGSYESTNVWELRNAYREVSNEFKIQGELRRSRDAYLAGTETAEQRAVWEKLRKAAYKGFATGRLNKSTLEQMRIYSQYEQEVVRHILAIAKKKGYSDVHAGSDSFGSAEKFGSVSPDAYSRQSRPRRQNDDLDSF